eukprot:358130-Chlamydomonas_euryale.AAC.13
MSCTPHAKSRSAAPWDEASYFSPSPVVTALQICPTPPSPTLWSVSTTASATASPPSRLSSSLPSAGGDSKTFRSGATIAATWSIASGATSS